MILCDSFPGDAGTSGNSIALHVYLINCSHACYQLHVCLFFFFGYNSQVSAAR